MRIIIAGTRTYNDYNELRERMTKLLRYEDLSTVEIITGGAPGADALGERFAKRNDLKHKRFDANWYMFGKAAGPIRNEQMVKYAKEDDHCILVCFWDGKSKGTKNMIDVAQKYGLEIEVFEYGK